MVACRDEMTKRKAKVAAGDIATSSVYPQLGYRDADEMVKGGSCTSARRRSAALAVTGAH